MQHPEGYKGTQVETRGFARQDLDTARYLVLHRISIRKKTLHQQWDISTIGNVTLEGEGRL